jgi:hypothetical protein
MVCLRQEGGVRGRRARESHRETRFKASLRVSFSEPQQEAPIGYYKIVIHNLRKILNLED